MRAVLTGAVGMCCVQGASFNAQLKSILEVCVRKYKALLGSASFTGRSVENLSLYQCLLSVTSDLALCSERCVLERVQELVLAMSYAMDPWEKRVELPSVQEVFYGPREPTYFVDTEPYYQRRPVMVPPPAYVHARDVDPVYRTRALVAPSSTQTHVVPVGGPVVNTVKLHPQGLVLSVPMCCNKCVEKVRKALEDLDGVRDMILDQYNQLVTIHGDVDPERALRRVRRVKKRSKFWKMATQPLQYSGSPATGHVHSKSLINEYRAPVYRTSAYRAPGYHTSAYRAPAYAQYLTPPRHPSSSYSRAYSSPYIDSAYRSGYVEPRGVYNPYGRFAFDDLEHRSRFDRGTPYLQMIDDL